jgi:hypothetical protein
MDLEHEPEVKKTLEECDLLIDLFQSMELYPAQLLEIKTKLSAYFYFLNRKKADYQKYQNTDYWIRKVEYGRHAIAARKKISVNSDLMAGNVANTQIEKEIENANISVWRYEHLKASCKGIEMIIFTVGDRLKDAESEKRISKAQQKGGNSW